MILLFFFFILENFIIDAAAFDFGFEFDI